MTDVQTNNSVVVTPTTTVTEATTKVRSFLGKIVKLDLDDGRILVGRFRYDYFVGNLGLKIDRQANKYHSLFGDS